MQANWSLILNVVLLAVVIVAMVRHVKSRKHQDIEMETHREPANKTAPLPAHDDIISVRKISPMEDALPAASVSLSPKVSAKQAPQKTEEQISLSAKKTTNDKVQAEPVPSLKNNSVEFSDKPAQTTPEASQNEADKMLMMFIAAKDGKKFAGYELLQTLLAAGLRFGDGALFHRHQMRDDKEELVCSLAAATETGTFDLQNMGAFSARGLCLFLKTSGDAAKDLARFEMTLECARQIAEGMDANIFDDKQKLLSQDSFKRFEQTLNRSLQHLAQTIKLAA